MEIRPLYKEVIRCIVWAVFASCCGVSSSAVASEPLHVLIDREIATPAAGQVAGPAQDEEFLRRVYLDLAGSIPTSQEAIAFLADTSVDKRAKLIDALLDSPLFARRMQEAWTVMLLERQEGKAVSDESWNTYLQNAFAANQPWDVLVRELVRAAGEDGAFPPSIRFFVDGKRSDPHQRTQDFARLFLGMNLQCAQCHDHPTIDDYKQAHYFGLFAFLSPSQLAKDTQDQPHLIEALVKSKTEFVSVFLPDVKHALGPKLLESEEVSIPPLVEGEEFAVPKQNGLPGIPKFQPRKMLGEQLTGSSPVGRRFARNVVNRFWFLFMGRGLVHPLDFDHSDNPPSHAELLELLTDAFIDGHYDVKNFVREICLSSTYQRTSQCPEDWSLETVQPASYRLALLRPMSPEQLAHSLAEAMGRRERLDKAPRPEKGISYKDYSNGRTELPSNWPDVMTIFAGAFGHPAGEAEIDFRPSVDQALFLANDRLLRDWLQPLPDGLVHRAAAKSGAEGVDEIYLSLLTRRPSSEEREVATRLLEGRPGERDIILQDLCLAIITSAEFRLNH